MAEDVLEDAGGVPDSGRTKRTPPTIDLDATKISETAPAQSKSAETKSAETMAAAEPQPEVGTNAELPQSDATASGSPPISPWVIAPMSGAVAAALVILVGWLLGWPAPAVQAPPAAPQVSAATVDRLATRVAGLESKTAKSPAAATDPAAARIDGLEKSLNALRGDLANLRTQSEQLAAAVNDAKSASHAAPAPPVDLSAINQRLDQIERTNRAQSTAIANADEKATAASKVEDDKPLRRVVAAALLDVAVRHGDPYEGPLAAAKALAPDPTELKPLDEFAAKGVPNPPQLIRELLTLVPKLSPAAENTGTGSSLVDRLQEGAAQLVHVERTDANGNDRSAVVARATSAALRNDFADARRELASLAPADRAPAQAWLDKAAARDAALAASRQFADDMMAALAKSAQ